MNCYHGQFQEFNVLPPSWTGLWCEIFTMHEVLFLVLHLLNMLIKLMSLNFCAALANLHWNINKNIILKIERTVPLFNYVYRQCTLLVLWLNTWLITLLNVQVSYCGPLEYISGMVEKLSNEIWIQTELPASDYYISRAHTAEECYGLPSHVQYWVWSRLKKFIQSRSPVIQSMCLYDGCFRIFT